MILHERDHFLLMRKYRREFSDVMSVFRSSVKEIDAVAPGYCNLVRPPACLYAAAIMRTHSKLDKTRARAAWVAAYFQLLDPYIKP